jgi:type IV secretory pathway VirB2 component (pilin)
MTRFWIFPFLTALIFPFEASASDVFVSEICNVFNIVSGPAGKAFAAFAILSVGIGFFSGKVSWGLLVGVAAATSTIFGAPSIVSAVTGKPSFQCFNTTYHGACVNGVCSCPTGLTGITCNECSTGYIGASCDICDYPSYSSVNGTCKRSCDIRSVPGINQIYVLHGSTSTTCNAANYSGSINYTCDEGSLTLASGSSCSCSGNYAGLNCASCATGYRGANCEDCDQNNNYYLHNGICQQSCRVTGQFGINDTTVIPGPGTMSCNSPAIGLLNYNCSGGRFTITSGSCAVNPLNSYCFQAAENQTLTMPAPPGKTWVGVGFASYGTPNQCSINTNCHASSSASVVYSACINRTTCSINASNTVFSPDPCQTIVKRLHVILYYN